MADPLEAGDDDYDAYLGYHEHLQRRRIRLMRAAVGSFFRFDAPSNVAAHFITPSRLAGMARPT